MNKMKLFCLIVLCVVLTARGQIISIRQTVFNLYFGTNKVLTENAEKLSTKLPAVEEILAKTEVADAPMEPDDTDLNEVTRNFYVNKCIMSFCVAYCRKMGYHRGVCIPPDTCDCYD